jgi:hypothetical protein
MYFEDNFDPVVENDYETNSVSVSSETTVTKNSVIIKQRKALELLKLQDNGYHKIKRVINGKTCSIELYNNPNVYSGCIRDAITGIRNPQYALGTSDEDLFFKVKICTGEKGLRNENVNFFFDSPEQYERYTGSVVNPEVKETWRGKNLKAQIERR